MTKQDAHDLQPGEEVSWKWGAGHPKGEVIEVVDGEAEIETNRGNTVKKNGDESNPAVKIKTQNGNQAVKKVSSHSFRLIWSRLIDTETIITGKRIGWCQALKPSLIHLALI